MTALVVVAAATTATVVHALSPRADTELAQQETPSSVARDRRPDRRSLTPERSDPRDLTLQGVRVLVEPATVAGFLAPWRGPADSGFTTFVEATPIRDAAPALARLSQLRVELAIYEGVDLSTYLDRVVLVDHLRFGSRAAGGLWRQRTVVLADRPEPNRSSYSETAFRRNIHHEFSSSFWRARRDLFPDSDWRRCNPEDFEYLGDPEDAVRRDWTEPLGTQATAELGFATRYGMASVEEDFNTVCGNMFSGSQRFWRRVDGSPRLRKKVNLAVEFYRLLSSRVSESSLRSLCEGRPR